MQNSGILKRYSLYSVFLTPAYEFHFKHESVFTHGTPFRGMSTILSHSVLWVITPLGDSQWKKGQRAAPLTLQGWFTSVVCVLIAFFGLPVWNINVMYVRKPQNIRTRGAWSVRANYRKYHLSSLKNARWSDRIVEYGWFGLRYF